MSEAQLKEEYEIFGTEYMYFMGGDGTGGYDGDEGGEGGGGDDDDGGNRRRGGKYRERGVRVDLGMDSEDLL